MSKSVLMSINPYWCELIMSGKKTLEIRKNVPREFCHDRFEGGFIVEPFKVYVYETQGHIATPWMDEDGHMIFKGSGEVVGEFVCRRIEKIDMSIGGYLHQSHKDIDSILRESCMNSWDLLGYLLIGHSEYKDGYAWFVSDVVKYDKPKILDEFKQCHKCPYGDYANCLEYECSCDNAYNVRRAPQSWCYVEEWRP